MRNYSRRFRRNYRGGLPWPFDDKKEEGAQPQPPENSDPVIIQQAENTATDAFSKVTSMLPSFSGSSQQTEQPTEQPQSGGRRSRRSRRSSRKSKRRRSRRR